MYSKERCGLVEGQSWAAVWENSPRHTVNYCALSGPVGFPTPPRTPWSGSLQPQAYPVPGLPLSSLSTPALCREACSHQSSKASAPDPSR